MLKSEIRMKRQNMTNMAGKMLSKSSSEVILKTWIHMTLIRSNEGPAQAQPESTRL